MKTNAQIIQLAAAKHTDASFDGATVKLDDNGKSWLITNVKFCDEDVRAWGWDCLEIGIDEDGGVWSEEYKYEEGIQGWDLE